MKIRPNMSKSLHQNSILNHFFPNGAAKQRYMGIQMQTRSTWEYEVSKKKHNQGEKEVIREVFNSIKLVGWY